MDYIKAAEELLDIQSALQRLPGNSEISRMAGGEWFVLYYLLTHGGRCFPKEISGVMMVSTARVAALLNGMEAKRLVSRAPYEPDSRRIVVSLTAEGREQIECGRRKTMAMFARVLESIGPEDTLELIRIQKKLLAGFARE